MSGTFILLEMDVLLSEKEAKLADNGNECNQEWQITENLLSWNLTHERVGFSWLRGKHFQGADA